MRAKVFLSLFLITLLIIPCFADSYIITLPKGKIGISSLTQENIKGNPIYGTNSYSGELTENQIGILKNSGFTIYPNLKVHAFLDQSVPQIQADKVWKEKVNETNLTGKGQTICIIDTGIDYNHSALGNGWGNKVITGWRFLDGCTITNQSCNCTHNNSACLDDNGHGTHVAGIVASNNTTYKGVAPDSKLVVVKALNGAGSGSLSNVVAGINYCVSHSEEYNISVISMSLGTPDYHNNTYCDGEAPTLTSAINNATAKNISVIVASGNEYYTDAISLPACIQNATPVGSVSSGDSISGFSNRWNLSQIFAPGENIYSSVPNYSVGSSPPINSSTGWKNLGGTSMATPHVAGAFALINQYLKLSNKTKTPQQLEDLFIRTGVNIDSNENYSRIDPYLTYLNLSFFNNENFNVSIEPEKLEFILELNNTETKNLTINSTKNINITITFSNLSGEGVEINNSNIFAWKADNLSNNATGNETLTINNVNNTAININLTALEDSSGIYTGKISVNITEGTNSTIVPVIIKANILYKLKKKIEIETNCETKNYKIEIGNIKSLVIKGNFSNLTNSYITVKNLSGDKIANSSKTNVTDDKIKINNPQSGILNVELGCLKSTSNGNVSNQSVGSMNEEGINATWIFTTSSLELGQDKINLSLTPENTTTSNFNLSTNTTEENVSLSTNDFFLTYGWTNQTISNQTAKNFTFIIPFSSNLIANLTWTNSTSNLTLNLTNLRNQTQTYFTGSGSGNQIIELEVNNISYGIWQARIFGENVSAANETFNLTIKFLDKRNNGFKINFTDIKHKFENKIILNGTTQNWTFYVDNNSVNSINVSLVSNAINGINLSLYNSTGSLINSTKGGNNWTFTTDISEGYWTVLINNTNQTANFTYNLTIHLSGNNITELGNLTNESSSIVQFNLTSPATKVVNGDYTSVISITATNCQQNITLNINLSAPILKLRPNWTDNYYIGNQSLEVGETETYNTTRYLFINLNQTKTFSFTINNSGDSLLYNLTQTNSTNLTNTANNSFALNFTSIMLSNNVSFGGIGYLNITIEPLINSSYLGNYSGWIYLNSSNGEPYNCLNLTLNIIVTNQTLPRPNLVNNIYYINDSTNLTPVTFEVYSYDNQTLIDNSWNDSKDYNFTLKNSTGTNMQNPAFSVNSGGLFSDEINTTNLSEGNYTLSGNITDEAGNIAEVNLTFELLHNLNPTVTSNLNSIVKGYPFNFTVNVSKLGNLTAENVTVCLSWSGTGLDNLNSSNCSSIGNISNTSSDLATWNFSGSEKKNYTININTYSEDGRFNYTEEEKIVVKYGTLIITWKTEPPADVDKDTEFYVKVYINNTGNLDVTGVLVNITYSSTDFTKTSGDNSCSGCSTITAGSSCDGCYWKLKPTTVGDSNEIEITATGNNATSYTKLKDVDINTPSSSDDGSGGDTSAYYGISFLKPTSSSFYIAQGETYDLKVEVKNTGNSKLNELYLILSGLDSDYYSITSSVKDDLISGSTEEYTIHFSIPEDFESKAYDLTLKAISNEKNETKSITLTVEQKDLQVYEVTDLNITQGETGTLTFYVKNTGEATLHKVYPALTGISGELFEINSSDTITLYKDGVKYYTIEFTIPKTESLGTKEINLTIASDEINISQPFNLTILPSEEEKLTINDNYEELVAQLKVILNKLEKAKKENKNTSSIASEIESANFTLAQIEEYISTCNYAEAKNLITHLNIELNSMSSEFENLETVNNDSTLLILAVVAFSIILVGIVVAYTFIPRKGYVVGKGYTMTNKKSKLEQSIKNIFKKLGIKESDEDKLRNKKLTEWRKWYKKETKKRKY